MIGCILRRGHYAKYMHGAADIFVGCRILVLLLEVQGSFDFCCAAERLLCNAGRHKRLEGKVLPLGVAAWTVTVLDTSALYQYL